MGGRGTYAAGKDVGQLWVTVGYFHGIPILEGTGDIHRLPEEAHGSNAYVQLHKDGNLKQLRFYDDEHYLRMEIGYHPEPSLTGHHKHVYHIHEYSRDFVERSRRLFTEADMKEYGRYLTVEGHLK